MEGHFANLHFAPYMGPHLPTWGGTGRRVQHWPRQAPSSASGASTAAPACGADGLMTCKTPGQYNTANCMRVDLEIQYVVTSTFCFVFFLASIPLFEKTLLFPFELYGQICLGT